MKASCVLDAGGAEGILRGALLGDLCYLHGQSRVFWNRNLNEPNCWKSIIPGVWKHVTPPPAFSLLSNPKLSHLLFPPTLIHGLAYRYLEKTSPPLDTETRSRMTHPQQHD